MGFQGEIHPEPSADEAGAELAIVGGETADHTVPADVLLRALGGLNRIVRLIEAIQTETQLLPTYGIPDATSSEELFLRCGVPKASSYVIPLSLRARKPPHFSMVGPSSLDVAMIAFQAATRGKWAEMASFYSGLYSNQSHFPRLLSEILRMLPRPGERWRVDFRVGRSRVSLDHSVYRSLRDYLEYDADDPTMTVTGKLLNMNVLEGKVAIRFPTSGQELTFQCNPSLVGPILEKYDIPIQVTGQCKLDGEGKVVQLSDISRIESLDLSPITFDEILWRNRRLIIEPPLTLCPEMDGESGQLYVLTENKLGIHVFAQTRDQLIEELEEQLLFLWDTFARERPNRLTASAQQLREALLKRMREVSVDT